MAVDKKLWVVLNGTDVATIHDTHDAAQIAAGELEDAYEVKEASYKPEPKTAAKKSPAKKAAKRSSPVDGGEHGEEDSAAAPTKKKAKTTPKKKKEVEVPSGIDGVFRDFSFAFIGTTPTPREALTKCVTNHSGTVTKKLNDANFIVEGKNISQNQKDELETESLQTITEDQFMVFLKTGDQP